MTREELDALRRLVESSRREDDLAHGLRVEEIWAQRRLVRLNKREAELADGQLVTVYAKLGREHDQAEHDVRQLEMFGVQP